MLVFSSHRVVQKSFYKCTECDNLLTLANNASTCQHVPIDGCAPHRDPFG